jgi:hypothetical protein
VRRRTVAQWDHLTSAYRDRLERKGITRESYLSGAKLSEARGHKYTTVHARQQKIIDKYGPKNAMGDPEITPSMLRKARRKYGEEWVSNRLEQLKRDYEISARGGYPYSGDGKYEDRSESEQRYSRKASRQYNYYAPFWWYRGVFGKWVRPDVYRDRIYYQMARRL